MQDIRTDQLIEINAKLAALRDIVARLVAYEVSRSETPSLILEDFSEATALGIGRLQAQNQFSEVALLLHEKIQSEVDSLLASARRMIDAAGD